MPVAATHPQAPALGRLQKIWMRLRVRWWGGAQAAWEKALSRGDHRIAERLWSAGIPAQAVEGWALVRAMGFHRFLDDDDREPAEDGLARAMGFHRDRCPVLLLQAALGAGANPNAQDAKSGRDALLHHAIQSPELTAVLLAAGACVDQRNRAGRTPLAERLNDYAHLPRARRVVALLLEAGADPNAPDGLGNPPLSEMGPRSMVPLLLKKGANPAFVCGNGRLAFHAGLELYHEATLRRWVRACLAAGVALDAPDDQGRTFLFHAVVQATQGRWANHGRTLLDHLMSMGADLRVKAQNTGDTVLHALLKEQSNPNWAPLVDWLLAKDGPWLVVQKDTTGKTVVDRVREGVPTGIDENAAAEWAGVRARIEAVWLAQHLEEGMPVGIPPSVLNAPAEISLPRVRRSRL